MSIILLTSTPLNVHSQLSHCWHANLHSMAFILLPPLALAAPKDACAFRCCFFASFCLFSTSFMAFSRFFSSFFIAFFCIFICFFFAFSSGFPPLLPPLLVAAPIAVFASGRTAPATAPPTNFSWRNDGLNANAGLTAAFITQFQFPASDFLSSLNALLLSNASDTLGDNEKRPSVSGLRRRRSLFFPFLSFFFPRFFRRSFPFRRNRFLRRRRLLRFFFLSFFFPRFFPRPRRLRFIRFLPRPRRLRRLRRLRFIRFLPRPRRRFLPRPRRLRRLRSIRFLPRPRRLLLRLLLRPPFRS